MSLPILSHSPLALLVIASRMVVLISEIAVVPDSPVVVETFGHPPPRSARHARPAPAHRGTGRGLRARSSRRGVCRAGERWRPSRVRRQQCLGTVGQIRDSTSSDLANTAAAATDHACAASSSVG